MYPPVSIEPPVTLLESPWRRVLRERLWLHILLLLLTVFTTSVVGAGLAETFRTNQPLNLENQLAILFELPHHLSILWSGLPFSLTLLGILFAHEMGHYITCLRYDIDASLPYFIPAPTLIGTFGAFIRIRSRIYSRRALFDVGIAGPIAGFVVLVPALLIGLSLSKIRPGVALHGDFVFGTPLLLRLLEGITFPGVSIADINLHPVARAAWVGILATALNLLPVGQLDGGHIVYSFTGKTHKLLSALLIVALILAGLFFSRNWLVLAAILAVFGFRHPRVPDFGSLGPVRGWLGAFALAMLILCFTLTPVRLGQ